MENSLNDLFEEIEQIKNNGDLVFIKFDGERESNKITLVIDFSKKSINRNQIRLNGDDLKDLIIKGLELYKTDHD
jgi:hypothetical protein